MPYGHGDGMPLPVALGISLVLCLLAISAVVDARERRFPHALGICLAAVCAWLSYAQGGAGLLMHRASLSLISSCALMAFEVLWRRLHEGRPGLGMGDIKCLFALSLWRPLDALISYAGALACLACACLLFRRRSLPLLPFLAPMFALLQLARLVGPMW